MSLNQIQQAITNEKMRCPTCGKAIKEFEKFVEMTDSVWDGAGDSKLNTAGSKVTLICGNDKCPWRERTEFWDNYIE
jgi:hypothetical protein